MPLRHQRSTGEIGGKATLWLLRFERPIAFDTVLPESRIHDFLQPLLSSSKIPMLYAFASDMLSAEQYPLDTLSKVSGLGLFDLVIRRGRLRGVRLTVPHKAFIRAFAHFHEEERFADTAKNDGAARVTSKICVRCKQNFYWLLMDLQDPMYCVECKKHIDASKAAVSGQIRKVREIYAPGQHTEEEWQSILEKFNHKCLRCKKTERITKDHVQPLSRGGSNYADNLQPLCNRCNSWKGTRTIDFRNDYLSEESTKLLPLNGVPLPDSRRRAGRSSGSDGHEEAIDIAVPTRMRIGNRHVEEATPDSHGSDIGPSRPTESIVSPDR